MIMIIFISDILQFFWDYLLKSAENLGVKIICEDPKKHYLFNQNLNKNGYFPGQITRSSVFDI